MKSFYIGIDFDSTIVKYAYPEIGEPIDYALETLEKLQNAGHRLILITMRSEERLAEAVEYLEENGIKLWAVNDNPSQKHWTKSPKIFANLYIDDLALGIPLDVEASGRPFVDWVEVEQLLIEKGFLDE